MVIKGLHGKAVVHTSFIEESAKEQIKELVNQQFTANKKIHIMPDVHSGKGCVIGTTMEIENEVSPSLVGVDIGCGVLCVPLREKIDPAELDKKIRSAVPSGATVRATPLEESAQFFGRFRFGEFTDRDALSLGTLGGGNHFIELAENQEGDQFLLIHSGSRNLGVRIAQYYQNVAFTNARIGFEFARQKILSLKGTSEARSIEGKLRELQPPSKDLCLVRGTTYADYLWDMALAQKFANENRLAIARQILDDPIEGAFDTIHNYIEIGGASSMLRKGAVSAKDGELLVIPMNMRDGTLLCVGKGNDEWNHSAPHGAGRIMSRTEAKKKITLEEFQSSMSDVYSTSVSKDTIDEAPMAYKPMAQIIDAIGETVSIIDILKPVYNYKDSN